MRVIYRHIKQSEQHRQGKCAVSDLFGIDKGFCQETDADVPVQEKGQQEKGACQDIAGLHTAGFHESPGRKKTFNRIQKDQIFLFFIHEKTPCKWTLIYDIELRGACQRYGRTLCLFARGNSGQTFGMYRKQKGILETAGQILYNKRKGQTLSAAKRRMIKWPGVRIVKMNMWKE